MRRAIVAGCGVGVAVGWNISNVGAVAEHVAVDYGIALATVGLFTTALFAVHSALQVPGGRATDRIGARRVALAGLALIAAANAVALAVPDPALGISARALAGIGTGIGFVAGSDYIRAAGGSPFAQGLFGGMGVGGGGLALAVVPQVERLADWRAPYLTALAVALAALLVLAPAPRDPPRTERLPVERAEDVPPRLFTDVRLYRLAAMHAVSLGLSVIVGNWVVTLLVRADDFGTGAAGAIGALTLAGGLVTRPGAGLLARRRPDLVRAALATSLVAGALGTAALAVSTSPAVAVAGAILVGLAAGVPFAPAFAGAARVRPDAPGAAIGFVNMAANIVILAGTPLLGLAFSLPGDGRIGFAAVAALWAVALLALPRSDELGAGRD